MAKRMTPTLKFVLVSRQLGVPIWTHREWGSLRKTVYRLRRRVKKHSLLPGKPVDTVWQHITVTRDSGKTRRSFFVDARTVEGIGFSRFLTGMSYNVLVDMTTGEAALGQPLDAAGAHTLNDKQVKGYSFNQNYVSLAIAFSGMPGDKLSPKAIKNVSRLLAAGMILGFIKPGFDYNPHSMVAWKECPTEAVRQKMPEIYKEANEIYERHKKHDKHDL